MNFKHFCQAQFSKLKNGINCIGEFRYDTISYVANVPYQSDNWFENC